MRVAVSVPGPRKTGFVCLFGTAGHLAGGTLGYVLGGTLEDELHHLIRRERIKLGEVEPILRGLLAQRLHPRSDRTWPAVAEHPLIQRRVLSRLPRGDLLGDLVRPRVFRTCFDDLGCVAGLALGDCFGPRGEATLAVRKALPPAVHYPLGRLTAGPCVFRGAGCRALTESGRVRLGAVCHVSGMLRDQELGTVLRCFLGKRLHNIREKYGNLRIGGFCQIALRLVLGLVSRRLVTQPGDGQYPVLSLRIGLRDPLNDPVALSLHDRHRAVSDEVYDSLVSAFGGVLQTTVGAVSGECVDELLLRIAEVGGDDVQGVRLAAAGHADIDASGVELVSEYRVRSVHGSALDAVGSDRVAEVSQTHSPVIVRVRAVPVYGRLGYLWRLSVRLRTEKS